MSSLGTSMLAALAIANHGIASAQPTSSISSASQQQTFGSTPLVHLELYRHGFSCVNIIEKCTEPQLEFANISSYNFEQIATGATCMAMALAVNDPLLTDFGVQTSWAMGNVVAQRNPTPDIVMASTMVRAMETAAYMFSKAGNIYQVPYVKEEFVLPSALRGIVGEGPEVPMSIADQRTLLKQYDGSLAAKFNWDLIPAESTQMACDASGATSDPRCISDFNKFLEWFGNRLATNPPTELAAKLAQRQPVTVALVVHGDLLQNQVLINGATDATIPDGGVQNNMGFRATYALNGSYLQRTTLWSNIAGAEGVPYNCPAATRQSGIGYGRCQARQPAIFETAKTKCFSSE